MFPLARSLILVAFLLPLLAVLGWQGQRSSADEKEEAWGTIRGRIVWQGDKIPQRQELKVDAAAAARAPCLAKGPILDDVWVVDRRNKGVRDVFVWLENPNGEPLPIHPDLRAIKQQRVEMDQPCSQFVPHALAMREGQTLVAKNSGPIVHNFKWIGHPAVNPGGGVVFPAGGSTEIRDLKADKYPIQIQCNIHPWMQGWVRVFNHPYYAVTGKDGSFEIKQVPAGNWRLKVWHAGNGWRGGAKGRSGEPVAIKANEVTDLGVLAINISKAAP